MSEIFPNILRPWPRMSSYACIPVSVKKVIPPDKKALGTICVQNTKSGAGEQFLLLACRPKALTKELLFTDTGIYVYTCVLCTVYPSVQGEMLCLLDSTECFGHQRKGTPGAGNLYQVLSKCIMPDNNTIKCVLGARCRIIV